MPIYYEMDPATGNVTGRGADGKTIGQWLAADVIAVPGVKQGFRVQWAKMQPVSREDSRLGDETSNPDS
jgi:hypothetical protein